MRQMAQLLWKDYRLNRSLLVVGVVGLAGVYLIGLATEIAHAWPALPDAKVWADGLYSYGTLALGIMPFFAALLGGNAIYCERADRTAHFLGYLPPTKAQILASKFIVVACVLAIFFIGILVSMFAIAPLIHREATNFMYMLGNPRGALAGCIFTFGIGWLGSAWFEKPTIPVLAALAAPMGLGFALITIAAALSRSRFEILEWTGTVCIVIGVAAFAVGAACYFRRVEP